MNLAVRFLPPLSVIAAFALPAVLLRPGPASPPERRGCLELPMQDARTTETIARANLDVEACLVEWNEREPGDADLLVRLRMNEAVGHAETEAGPPSPSLWLCVAEAVARMDLKTRDYVEADVFIRWTSGKLKLSIQVTERAPAIQLSRDAEIQRARMKLAQLKREKAALERELARRRAARH